MCIGYLHVLGSLDVWLPLHPTVILWNLMRFFKVLVPILKCRKSSLSFHKDWFQGTCFLFQEWWRMEDWKGLPFSEDDLYTKISGWHWTHFSVHKTDDMTHDRLIEAGGETFQASRKRLVFSKDQMLNKTTSQEIQIQPHLFVNSKYNTYKETHVYIYIHRYKKQHII